MKQSFFEYFKGSVLKNASMSKDADTKVGAVIFSEKYGVEVSSGWNCLARGVKHVDGRNSRPLKYKYTTHAEMNAVANAALLGRSTGGMSLMVNLYPCTTCANMIVNAGIKKVYCPAPDYEHKQYGEDFKISETIFKEAGVDVVEVEIC